MRSLFLIGIGILAFSASPPSFAAPIDLSSTSRSFPNSLPGESIEVKKILDPITHQVTIVSPSRRVNSERDLVALEDQETRAIRTRYGGLDDGLALRFASLKDGDQLDLMVSLKNAAVPYLDKTKNSDTDLKAHTRRLIDLPASTPIETFTQKHAVKINLKLSQRSFRCKLAKDKLRTLMFDPDVAQISEYIESKPLQAKPAFTTLATSAYNPAASMPSDARGQGVNAATFETGITTDFRICLSNVNPAQVDLNEFTASHSLETFKCLWQTATAANLWHRHSTSNFFGTPGYAGTDDHNYIANLFIQSVSLSYDRSSCHPGCDCLLEARTIHPYTANNWEFLDMDQWAYMWPFPVFSNPTANWGHQYESNWQGYNGISVGNVQHKDLNHFQQPVLVRPVCAASDGANQSRNPQNRYGGPSFKAADAVYNYASGDREMPYLVVPGITPTSGTEMNDPCLPPNSGQARTALWMGTSYSAPTANGIAASIIGSNSRMVSWPEKVRAAMLVTAENVTGGYWNSNAPGFGGVDGMDGNGVVSGAGAVAFARNHTDVSAGHVTAVKDGMCAGSLYGNEGILTFKALVPASKPAGMHLRAVLTWDSNPVISTSDNRLTDLDLDAFHPNQIAGSHSYNGNVETIDIPSASLTAGGTVLLKVNSVVNRIPAGAFIYYCIAWTWVKDHAA
jgi:subtilase family protein